MQLNKIKGLQMKTFSKKFEQNANLQLRKVTRAIDLYVKNVYIKSRLIRYVSSQAGFGMMQPLPQHPLKRIIAIGIEPVKYSKTTSEDIAFIDCSQWTDEQQQRFRELRNIMKIWRTPLDKATKFQAKEYPDVVSKKVGRNDPCPCQSGKKYKKCCGR